MNDTSRPCCTLHLTCHIFPHTLRSHPPPSPSPSPHSSHPASDSHPPSLHPSHSPLTLSHTKPYPGDGWSARYEDAATHGCVPVILMDHTLGPFEGVLDYSAFALRVGERELGRLVDILTAVTPQRLAALQEGLAKAWMRFRCECCGVIWVVKKSVHVFCMCVLHVWLGPCARWPGCSSVHVCSLRDPKVSSCPST